jgi:nitrous oxidase accessory protein NosD
MCQPFTSFVGSFLSICKSNQSACKTIGHAISLASSGDSIMVAAATYTENLTIGFSLRVIGSGAATTIVDGCGVNTVVTISSTNAHVSLFKLTIRMALPRRAGVSTTLGRFQSTTAPSLATPQTTGCLRAAAASWE